MLVTVDVPDKVAREFHLDEPRRSHQLLEAFLLQRYSAGELSAGCVGDALGLGFHETEQFLYDHGAPPNVSPEEQALEVAAVERLIAVVSDTSPLNYLVLVEAVNILPWLFSEVIVPPAVISELSQPGTPDKVRR